MVLVGVDIRRFAGFLHIHAEVDHVDKELHEVLILRIATLHAEGDQRFAVLHSESGCEGDPRPFARFDDVEWVFCRVEDEALHALAHADAGIARDAGGYPASTGYDGYHPSFFVGRFHRSGAQECRLEVFFVHGCCGSRSVFL